MACSKYEYVKMFERPDALLMNTWIVVRIDGHAFHKFTDVHGFTKPNDLRGLHLANECARKTMLAFPDIRLAYGQSDEYSFLLAPSCSLYSRRESKITSTIVSVFTSHYTGLWDKYFGSSSSESTSIDPSHLGTTMPGKDGVSLRYFPSFDGRAVCYPTKRNVQDYFAWRQVDCHINNLYNTCFWALVKGNTSDPSQCKNVREPMTNKAAQALLESEFGDSAAKNELLFSDFGRNYNRELEIFRKGSVLYRKTVDAVTELESQVSNLNLDNPQDMNEVPKSKRKQKKQVVVEHIDIINPNFWLDILSD